MRRFLLLLIAAIMVVSPLTLIESVFAEDEAAPEPGSHLMFRGNPARTGDLQSPKLEGEPFLKWRFKTAAPIVVSAAVVNGAIYVASWDHYFYALDAETGEERWRFKAGAGIFSSPAFDADTIYAGGNDGALYALNTETGLLRWVARAEQPIWSSPVVDRGVVYVGSFDGNFYAFDAADGTPRWVSKTEGQVWSSSPAIDGDAAYVGLYAPMESSFGAVISLDLETGQQRWSYPTRGGIYTAPAVKEGIVYASSYDGTLHAIEAETGVLVWLQRSAAGFGSSPAVSGDTVYISSRDGFLDAMDRMSGDVRWRTQYAGALGSSPIVADGVVYVSSDMGILAAIDAQTGEPRWQFVTLAEGTGSPIIVDGVIYIGLGRHYRGEGEGFVYAIAGKHDETVSSSFTTHSASAHTVPRASPYRDGSHHSRRFD